jgi:hypothetical protein
MTKSETKKQIPLRLNPKLASELNAWAESEFRSLNGQIEYLLSECVRKRNGRQPNENDAKNEPSHAR